MNLSPRVAVVILNFDGKGYLERFLPTLLASDYANFKVVVADNASSDDSISFLKRNFPAVEIIILEKNFGFAEGYNQALKQVQAEYFVLLNSDIEITTNWIYPIVNLMEADKQIAICQPKILSYNQKTHFEYAGAAGGWIDFLGYPFARGRVFETLEEDKNQYGNSSEIFWATGAAMFIKAEIYKSLGGLYGFFFAHQEEIDLCWRAQLAGYKVACCTSSVVYHVGGGTLPKGHRKTFLNFRNNLIMLSRNLPLREKLWKVPFRLILDGVFAMKCLLSSDFDSVKAILKAHNAYYKWLIKINDQHKFSKKPMDKLSGVSNHSIVWQYFIAGKKIFKEIF
ncbi:glycosyltransferase family 2 protein [Arachidicoccus sp.]|uniref:glycosyltransferase family 2 protein n=1 Tax=Arachidicoccus sp. TaxID=1872624 RepID=UPI003D1EB913